MSRHKEDQRFGQRRAVPNAPFPYGILERSSLSDIREKLKGSRDTSIEWEGSPAASKSPEITSSPRTKRRKKDTGTPRQKRRQMETDMHSKGENAKEKKNETTLTSTSMTLRSGRVASPGTQKKKQSTKKQSKKWSTAHSEKERERKLTETREKRKNGSALRKGETDVDGDTYTSAKHESEEDCVEDSNKRHHTRSPQEPYSKESSSECQIVSLQAPSSEEDASPEQCPTSQEPSKEEEVPMECHPTLHEEQTDKEASSTAATENSIDKELFESETSLDIMVVGQPGIGKSTLVNGLIGQKVAEVSALGRVMLEDVTKTIEKYSTKVGTATITVWDTPGLLDPSGDPEKVLADIQEKCTKVDLIFLCINMYEKRYLHGNIVQQILKRFIEAFGHDVWEKIVIVLMKANMVVNELRDLGKDVEEGYKRSLSDWHQILHHELGPNITVPIVPVGIQTRPKIMKTSEQYWLSNLWQETFSRMQRPEARASLIKVSLPRLKQKIEESDLKGKELHEQPIEVTTFIMKLIPTTGSQYWKKFRGFIPFW